MPFAWLRLPGHRGSNRTFMELKFCSTVMYSVLRKVLIVPLWN